MLSDIAVELVDTLARNNAASLSVLIVGFPIKTLGAGALNDVVAWSAVALAAVEVVDLVGSAWHAADALVDIVDLARGSLGAEVVDQEKSGLADTAA